VPATVQLVLLGAPLRSSLATEGTESSSTPLRTFAVSGARLGGLEVIDGGDLKLSPPGTTDFAAGSPVPKNESRVRESLRMLASRVSEFERTGATPVVFGGDATVLLGLFAGIHDGRTPPGRMGLLSMDGAARFRTPSDFPGGDLSAMVLAIATGRGPTSLAHLARERFPLLQDTDVILAGVRDASPAEAAALVESRVTILPPDRLIGTEGEAVFMGALGRLAPRTREIVLHLDVSVLEPSQFPVAATPTSTGGLSLERLKTLVGELSTWNSDGTIRISGVSITGVDARKDPGGVRMHELAGFAVRLFRRR
jgi:arginase